MTRVIIFGGHGRIALLTEPLLVAQGDEVTAVIRNPDQAAEVAASGATAVVADVEQLDEQQLAELITGHDAVIWSAGAGGGNPARTIAVDQDAAIRSIRAATKAGVSRYIMVSYFGAAREHGISPDNSFFTYAEAKAAADEFLRESPLEWTILQPSGLTFDEPSGLIDTEANESKTVSRANVAAAIVATLNDASTLRRSIRFNDGQTPIVAAIGAQTL